MKQIKFILKIFIQRIFSTLIFLFIFCENIFAQSNDALLNIKYDKDILTGAEQTDIYLPLIKAKTIAVVANPTSMIGSTHLVDSLLRLKIKIKEVFAPEHGFRGDAGNGEEIKNSVDKKTGLAVISLYGDHKKPTAKELEGVNAVVFDIQDVGARFYTYISTLQYVMEACAAKKIPLIVFDRPNPNGFYVDGPVLEKKFSSFVGLNPVPVVYGMTIGEYAKMLNGEHWLNSGVQCALTVIALKNYSHSDLYQLPVKPSPNLPNMASVYLYPSLCFFEGTMVSLGRGTDKPFQVIGYPGFEKGKYKFTPKNIPGVAVHPPYEEKECMGFDVSEFGDTYIKNLKKLYLYWLKGFYDATDAKEKFFTDYFNQLAGNSTLQEQIKKGMNEEEISKSWKPAIDNFKQTRKKYLLYQDFE